MKTYRNERHGFEIRIPEEWSAYPEGKAMAGDPLVIKCRANEAFHIEITPLTVTPFPYQVENEFRRLAEKKGCTNLIVGRFNADDKEHIFARFYMGYGQWMKKYRIILRGFDYVLTATCLDEKFLLEMEKDWDEVAASFCLMKRRDEPIVKEGEEGKKSPAVPVSQPIIWTDPFDLNKAMQILAMPVRLSEIPRRIELCQQALAHVDRKIDPELWAGLEVELAKNIGQYPLGDRAENIEQAILHNQRGLEVFNRKVYPEFWANIHINLGSNYRNRLYGDHAENLEQALAHCQQGLEVVTKEKSPFLWASAHNNLANVYRDRVHGERADNLEHAIDHIKQSLDVLTRHAFPFHWATAQNNLGNAYQDRKLGERELNIEQAIFCYEQALEVFKRETYPEDWAWTQCNLGISFHYRVRGDKSENMETSILHSKHALEVFTKETLPEKWALTHVNLGNAYLVRKVGERTENLKLGIDHFQLALSVFTQLAYPERWAGLQFNIATANQLLSGNELETTAMKNNENTSEARPPVIHLTYPEFYNETLGHNPDSKRRLKLIYSDVPDIKYATSMLLVYQWEDELSSDGAECLKRRAVAFLVCAIYDAARSSNLPCMVSPIPNGQRPAWMVEGERSPVSLTLSDIDMDDRTLQMSIGPVMVALHSLPVNKAPLEKIMNGFRNKFSEIMV
jgi:tetratricopeptide (TPR) repeat protein